MEDAARPLEFWDREDLQAWLLTQPREVAVTIAARASLRALPLLATATPLAGDLMGQERFPQLVTLLFHSVALTRFASLHPTSLNILPWLSTRSLIARIEFSYAAANSVAKTVRAALETVLAVAAPAAADTAQFSAEAAYAAVAVSKEKIGAGNGAEADIWRAISFDANSFSAGGLPLHQVAGRSLWPDSEPAWSQQRWAQLRNTLSALGDWDCWAKWYAACARGEHIPEKIEAVYATVRPDLWDRGPRAVNSWIGEQLHGLTEKEKEAAANEAAAPLEMKDRQSLESWLERQPREVAVIIGARAALRVLPLFSLSEQAQSGLTFAAWALELFHATALARVAAKYPNRLNELHDAAVRAAAYVVADAAAGAASHAALLAAHAASDAVSAVVVDSAPHAARAAADAANAVAAHADADAADADIWTAITADANFLRAPGNNAALLAVSPLWPERNVRRADRDRFGLSVALEPHWAFASRRDLVAALPKDQNWDVWIGWYEARLDGRADPEEIELVYATVPLEKWNEGPAAANTWIKKRLVQVRDALKKDNPAKKIALPAIGAKDRNHLEAWLREQAREVQLVIATRAALRVLPLFSRFAEYGDDEVRFANFTARLMRATAVSRVAAKYELHANDLHATETAAAVLDVAFTVCPDAAESQSVIWEAATWDGLWAGPAAAVYAAYTATAAVYGEDAAAITTAGTWVAASVEDHVLSAALWSSVTADSRLVSETDSPAKNLADQPLWPEPLPSPEWAAEAWGDLAEALPKNQDWDVWLAWYEARIWGRSNPEEIELVYVRVPQEKWDEGPAAVNAWIKAELDRLQRPVSARLEARVRPAEVHAEARVGWGFFLSYSAKDEAFARFVDDVLRQAGYSVFVRFRDIPAGANFVREMQNGLAQSLRVIALLSPNYVASGHCQAEWSAAYADDPSGQRRKLVQLLIAPTDLDPLARQIVYEPLLGLSSQDAADAILTAIGHRGRVTPRERWPGADALDCVIRDTLDSYQVEPDENRVLKRKLARPARELDKTEGYTAEQLYAQFRREIEKMLHHVHEPSLMAQGNFQFSARLRKHIGMLLAALPDSLDDCDSLAANGALVDVLRVLEHDDQDGLLPDHDLIRDYKVDLETHFEQLTAIFPNLKQRRKQNRKRRYKPPSAAAQGGLQQIVQVTAAHPEVVSEPIVDDLRASKEAIDAAKEITAADPEAEKEALAEPHDRVATQVIPLWNWLANSREKFIKSGENADEIAETLQKYGKVYSSLAGAKPFIDWLLSWWYA